MNPLVLGTLAGGAGLLLGILGTAWVLRARTRRALESQEAKIAAEGAVLLRDLEAEQTRRQETEHRLESEESARHALDVELARLRERTEQTQNLVEAQKTFLDASREELKNSFEALAASALKGNSEQFFQLAENQLDSVRKSANRDLEERQKNIEVVLKPLKEALDKLDTRTREMELSREGAYEGLQKQVQWLRETTESLKNETTGLASALKGSQVRGMWGEVALKNVVELAGMTEHCDFVEQDSLDNRSRPDMVVRLPESRFIAVDAKVPMAAYLSAVNADKETEQQAALNDHANALKKHIRELNQRDYAETLSGEVDLVVLFLPGDPFLAAASSADPALMEYALGHKVLLATPTTLVALLRTVAIYWQQRALQDNAKAIADTARELYDRAAMFGEHLDRAGKGLGMAVEAYNSAVASFRSRFLPMGKQLEELQSADKAKRKLEVPRRVEEEPREIPSQVSMDL